VRGEIAQARLRTRRERVGRTIGSRSDSSSETSLCGSGSKVTAMSQSSRASAAKALPLPGQDIQRGGGSSWSLVPRNS